MPGRNSRYAQIVTSIVDLDTCASILRPKTLRNVEAGNNLDARNHTVQCRHRQLHEFTQHAIGPEAYSASRSAGFDVNVACASFDCLAQYKVAQLDDRR